MDHYWLNDVNVPFRTLLCVVGTYCHPEAGPDAYGDLIRLARSQPDDEEMRRFKDELTQVLAGDTEGLHSDAMFAAACYNDGTDLAFARRLWRHLYPDEPMPHPLVPVAR